MGASHQRQKYVTACTAEVQTVLCIGASQRCHSALQCRSALQHHNNVTVHYSVEVSTGRVPVQERAGQLSLLGRCCHNNTIMTVTMMMTVIIERSSRMCWRERPCLCSSENILYHMLGNALWMPQCIRSSSRVKSNVSPCLPIMPHCLPVSPLIVSPLCAITWHCTLSNLASAQVQSWCKVWIKYSAKYRLCNVYKVLVRKEDLLYVHYTLCKACMLAMNEKILRFRGRVTLPNRMNFRKNSKQPSTPPPLIFGKLYFSENVRKNLKGPKSAI